jgi:hypothetical protein
LTVFIEKFQRQASHSPSASVSQLSADACASNADFHRDRVDRATAAPSCLLASPTIPHSHRVLFRSVFSVSSSRAFLFASSLLVQFDQTAGRTSPSFRDEMFDLLVSDRPSRTLAGGRVDLRCPLRGGPGSLGSVLIVSSCGGCGAWPINQPLALIAISLIGVASCALGDARAFDRRTPGLYPASSPHGLDPWFGPGCFHRANGTRAPPILGEGQSGRVVTRGRGKEDSFVALRGFGPRCFDPRPRNNGFPYATEPYARTDVVLPKGGSFSVRHRSDSGENQFRINRSGKGAFVRTAFDDIQSPKPFQAEYEGSIPFTRSTIFYATRSGVIWHAFMRASPRRRSGAPIEINLS